MLFCPDVFFGFLILASGLFFFEKASVNLRPLFVR